MQEGNVFRGVCQSFCSHGVGGYAWFYVSSGGGYAWFHIPSGVDMPGSRSLLGMVGTSRCWYVQQGMSRRMGMSSRGCPGGWVCPEEGVYFQGDRDGYLQGKEYTYPSPVLTSSGGH